MQGGMALRRGTSGGTAAFQNEPIMAVKMCMPHTLFFFLCVFYLTISWGGQRSSNAAMFWGQKAKDKKQPDSN